MISSFNTFMDVAIDVILGLHPFLHNVEEFDAACPHPSCTTVAVSHRRCVSDQDVRAHRNLQVSKQISSTSKGRFPDSHQSPTSFHFFRHSMPLGRLKAHPQYSVWRFNRLKKSPKNGPKRIFGKYLCLNCLNVYTANSKITQNCARKKS